MGPTADRRRPARAPRPPRGRWKPALLAGLLSISAGWVAGRAAEPRDLLEEIRSTALDPDRAVALENVDLEIGPAVLSVDRGLLVPTRPIRGRTVELVFVGNARFQLDPPDLIEAKQLELFAGQQSLDTPIEAAVLVLVDQDSVSALLGRSAPLEVSRQRLAEAERLHREWLRRTERRTTTVETALFKSFVGDAAFRDYFAVWCRTRDLGELVYQLDPEDVEPLTLARFIPVDLSGWDRRRLSRHIKVQQRKGRWLDVRVEDLGTWDVWFSTPWVPASGEAFPGNLGFETDHYDLDVTIKRGDRRLEGSARLAITAQASGRRVVTLELSRDLRVRTIFDDRGRELFFFRSGREIAVLLPGPSEAGEKLALDVRYAGRALKRVGRRTFDLEETGTWYPHCGTIDRATYDVTLRWPKRLDLLAGGRKIAGGRGGGYRWERRRLDSPAIAFSFALGEFIVEHRRVGHVDLTLGFNRDSGVRLSDAVREQTLDTVAGALEYFEDTFGPYPLDDLTAVFLPRQYSQSYLGFVTLTDSLLRSSPLLTTRSQNWFRDTTIAHEVAHQWWGNLLGWWSYRDQWLSEAMATYSGLLFHSKTRDEGRRFLADMSAGWRESLGRSTAEGRPIASLGPVVLGGRLNSSRAQNGYRAIVYRKGAVVLAMLARTIGEERFLEMLRSLVETAGNRVVTTESFIAALEHMSDLDLGGFANQFIYGTGIPQVYYEYTARPNERGGWTLRGEATQLDPPRYHLRVARFASGRWDLLREAHFDANPSPTALVVPYRVTLERGPDEGSASRSRTTRMKPVGTGHLFLHGPSDEFEIESELQPVELRLDPRDELLAYFYSAARNPKRVSRFRGATLSGEGRLAEAEAQYRKALENELGPYGEHDSMAWIRDPESAEQIEDARIRLALARLYVDQQREASAEAELDEVDRLLETNPAVFRMERDALRGRLDVRRGNHAAAFKRLKKTLRLAAPLVDPTGLRAVLWQVQLSSERQAMTEAFGLLAVAAHETGNRAISDWALREAKRRGVDVSALEQGRRNRARPR